MFCVRVGSPHCAQPGQVRRGVCVRVCSACALGVGWKCQELPSSTLEESSPRVIQHLPRAKSASTTNSSRRENPGRQSGSTPHVAAGRAGVGWRWGWAVARLAPIQRNCRRGGEVGRFQPLRERSRPSDHPLGGSFASGSFTHGARASPGVGLATCFSLQ